MKALPLDSPRWPKLRAAGGDDARDVPKLLARIGAARVKTSDWAELSDLLCHQFSIGEGSLAAVPHLLPDVERVPAVKRIPHLRLIAAITESAWLHDTKSSPDIRAAFVAALKGLRPVVFDLLTDPQWQAGDLRVLLEALACSVGRAGHAMVLQIAFLERRRVYIHLVCPKCGEEMRLEVSAEEAERIVEEMEHCLPKRPRRSSTSSADKRGLAAFLGCEPRRMVRPPRAIEAFSCSVLLDGDSWTEPLTWPALAGIASRHGQLGLSALALKLSKVVTCSSCQARFKATESRLL